ncbi:hypothetical protein Esi_0357_0016 [Ectocarpus siliculosus]|uniref:Uncharacterized protein n=1 Tax=Ectocarpus siliculosus TaxID=2880 RepID=D7FZ83_ECTSI|nr:hypothetical protein Esi_0357_0016 [Ectocarpus siliculosus]|eukprot:CBJ32700.1 hypothetical protein Esi_0357_0016 [Ectocarpus siliculosus]
MRPQGVPCQRKCSVGLERRARLRGARTCRRKGPRAQPVLGCLHRRPQPDLRRRPTVVHVDQGATTGI